MKRVVPVLFSPQAMLLVACSSPAEEAPPAEAATPLLTVCGYDTTPECDPSWCPDPIDDLWREGFYLMLEEHWELSPAEARRVAQVTSVTRGETSFDSTTVLYQLTLGEWRTSQSVGGSPGGAPPTAETAKLRLGRPAVLPVLEPPRTMRQVAAAIDACGQELGVAFDVADDCVRLYVSDGVNFRMRVYDGTLCVGIAQVSGDLWGGPRKDSCSFVDACEYPSYGDPY